MKSSKVATKLVLAGAIAAGIEYCLYFFPPEMVTVLSDLILGVPFLLTFLIFKVFGLDEFPATSWFFLTLFVPTFLYVAIIQAALSRAWKFNWKYLSCLLVVIFVVLANIGAGKIYILELTRPQWQTFEYKTFHFSVESPYLLELDPEVSTWTERNNSGKIYIVRQMKASSSVIHLASLTIQCKEYAEKAPSIQKLTDKWKKILDATIIKPANCSGLQAIQLYRSESNRTFITVKGRFQYYFSFIYSPESHEKGSEMADRIFNSIKIQD